MKIKTVLEWCKFLNIPVENTGIANKRALRWWRQDQVNVVTLTVGVTEHVLEVKRGKVELNKSGFLKILAKDRPFTTEEATGMAFLDLGDWQIWLPRVEDNSLIKELHADWVNRLYIAALDVLLPNLRVLISAERVRECITVTMDGLMFDQCEVRKVRKVYNNKMEIIARA